jgi:ubiquinone/menaquinone biosynthesis C-methylase UbiE
MDHAVDDNDSGYGESIANPHTTVAGSIYSIVHRFEYRHGRRYHGLNAGAYNFPNDELEQTRLDLVSYVVGRLIGDRLTVSELPSTPASAILDIGTGTGIWAIQAADAHPDASVIGVDLSPIQPAWVPPNVRFVVDDVELDWPDDTYDFIHCRYMAASIRDWPTLIRRIFQHLRPGGRLELSESVNQVRVWPAGVQHDPVASGAACPPLPAGHPLARMFAGLAEACERTGRTLNPAPSFTRWTRDAGFQSIREYKFALPVGSWHPDPRMNEMGSLMELSITEGCDAFTADLFTNVLGWSTEDVKTLNEEVRAAATASSLDGDDCRPVFDYRVVTAEKPS